MAAVVPHGNDVLLGRGAAINAHPGNVHFRTLVRRHQPAFRLAGKGEKRPYAARILEELGRLDPPGRFLAEVVAATSAKDGADAAGHGTSHEVPPEAGDGRAAPPVEGRKLAPVHPAILKRTWTIVDTDKAMAKVLHRLREKDPDEPGSEGGTKKAREGKTKVPKKAKEGRENGQTKKKEKKQEKDGTTKKAAKQPTQKERLSVSEARERWEAPPLQEMDLFDAPLVEAVGSERILDLPSAEFPATDDLDGADEILGPHTDDDWEAFLQNVLDLDADEEGPDDGGGAADPVSSAAVPSVEASSSAIDGDGAPHTHLDLARQLVDGNRNDVGGNGQAPSAHVHSMGGGGIAAKKGSHAASREQRGHLDEELDSFLRGFSSQHGGGDGAVLPNGTVHLPLERTSMQQNPTHPAATAANASDGANYDPQLGRDAKGMTLQQWMHATRAHLGNNGPMVSGPGHRSGGNEWHYIQTALPVAYRLVERLVHAEEGEARSFHPIPPASIRAENVSIRLGKGGIAGGATSGGSWVVEDVFLTSRPGEGSDVGSKMSRLFAVGTVLYELFSGEPPLLSQDAPPRMTAINLNDEDASMAVGNVVGQCPNQPRKKSSTSYRLGDPYSECLARLEGLGMPYSLRTLIKNLLDCGQGDLCGDDAYTSFQDVRLDLQLMLDDPSRFLDDITTNPLPQLVICDKLYGREKEVLQLEEAYNRHLNGACRGAIIAGKAGVGKSKLATHVQQLTRRANGYFLFSKFDQSNNAYPLSRMVAIFDQLCDLFARDANASRLQLANQALESALGSHASFLAGLLPSLGKIMPQCGRGLPMQNSFVDAAQSLRFLFGELLRVLSSSSSRPISICLDDLQWSDQASLQLIGGMISFSGVFFTFCYRELEIEDNAPLQAWLNSISMFSLEAIRVENMTVNAVNHLVSDALHLSPRMTRPLSSVLHHKTRGNPLFVRQLLDSLKEQGFVYVDLSCPRWAWELDKIMDMAISDNVLALMMKEMQRLPEDLQLALTAVSCLGSSVKQSVIDVLSRDLGRNLHDLLNQLERKGYMDKDESGAKFSFVHDKIQQAAYEMMPDQKRREYHMRFGLALCASSMIAGVENDSELFFLAVNQINKGGPSIISDPAQKNTIAALNLKAGRLSMTLSDSNTAFKLFKHGISFMDQVTQWESQYALSLELFDATAESAAVVNDRESVAFYADQLVAHAKCYDDKLNCMYAGVQALRLSELKEEAKEAAIVILKELEEPDLCQLGELSARMQNIDGLLQMTSDDSILDTTVSTQKRFVSLMKIYSILVHVLYFTQPALSGAASIRMVELTLNHGLCSASPLAFCYYGGTLMIIGKLDMACRLGGLALKLLEKKGSMRYKASVIAFVYPLIFWASLPMQSMVDSHLQGYKSGMQFGDVLNGRINKYFSVIAGYIAGNGLAGVMKGMQEFMSECRSGGHSIVNASLVHLQICALTDGLHVLEAEQVDGYPGLRETIQSAMRDKDNPALFGHKTHCLVRAFLFRQLDEASLDVNISDIAFAKKVPLRPLFVLVLFFEGLISFHFARRSANRAKWVAKGDLLLGKMQVWSEGCPWNFENKCFLLMAEKMSVEGDYEQAATLYERSIRSAHAHKFIHERAIACELAGTFFYERGYQPKAYSFFRHAIQCYKEWGAAAVAQRVETHVESLFGSSSARPGFIVDDSLVESVLASGDVSTKKRQPMR